MYRSLRATTPRVRPVEQRKAAGTAQNTSLVKAEGAMAVRHQGADPPAIPVPVADKAVAQAAAAPPVEVVAVVDHTVEVAATAVATRAISRVLAERSAEVMAQATILETLKVSLGR